MSVIIVGNVKINTSNLKNVLKKFHYWLHYDTETNMAKLSVNDGRGGKKLIILKDVDYVIVKKFAEGLGLKDDDNSPIPTFWNKWNPILNLHYDGSEEAEKLRLKMLKLGMPCRVIENSKTLGISDSGFFYDDSHDLRRLIEERVTLYKKQLSTVP